MKKRTIIAIIITIITIIATNKYWFVIRPLPVNFDILGHGNCNIEVQLNKKDNDEFKKVKSESIYINLDEKKHADIFVNRAKYPKRIKLIFSNLSSDEPIIISHLRFDDGRFTIDNIKKFKVDGADATSEDNNLILTPNSETITLTYPDTLHIRAKMDFDFLFFGAILILTFLLAYKLSNYVAEFNTIKGKSRVEVIFLTIFFIFLFIPMLHINQEDISQRENRTLAQWKPLIQENNTINFEFGKDFNDWFDDRFNLRELFLKIHDLKFILSRNLMTENIMKGPDDWLFLSWKASIDSYANNIMFTDEELASIDNYLGSIDKYCKTHNKKFYFIIAPDKSRIYPEYFPKSIIRVSDNSRSEQLIDYIGKHSKVNVVYPKNKLISQKGNNFLYWKDDTHWNLLGAYYGYSELMNIIKKDYKNISIYKIKEYTTEQHTGDLYNMTPVGLRKADNTTYKIPKVDNSQLCKRSKEDRAIITCSNENANINLLMYRDSFSTALIPYLAHSFGDSEYIWKKDVNPNSMKNADIIIFEIVERSLPVLVNKQMEIK